MHWGLEGLAATNRLVVKACEAAATNTTTTTTTTTGAASGFARPNSGDGDTSNMNSCGGGGDAIRTIVLRDELYRIAAAPADATSDQQATVVQQLKQTAAALPEICEWLDADEITMRARGVSDDAGAAAAPSLLMGGLRLHSGCCVLHVPSYLSGLWKACQDQAAKSNGSCSVDWRIITTTDDDNESEGSLAQQQQHDEQFDVTIYCGGAGMFATAHGADGTTTTLQGLSDVLLHQHQQTAFPVQLVRGQSIELRVPVMVDNQQPQNAVLCGKYISPLPQSQQHDGDTDGTTAVVLVGATHEFQAEPLSRDQVVAELRERTRAISSFDWDDTDAVVVERVTSGYRVQSARGKYGRRPIIGRLSSDGDNNNNNAWIFSGLSSRGLLYHGLYGEMLADAILRDDDGVLLERCPDLLWWKK